MFRSRALLASLVATLWLVAPLAAGAQPVTRLATSGTSGTIAANGESVVMSTGGLAAFAVQTLDSYSGTWEVQCSTDGGTTYDADDEVNLTLVGATSTVASVTDTVGIWQGNAAGCTHIKVIATAGFAATNTTVSIQAISSGGGSGGGAGGTFDGVLLDAAGGDPVTDTALDAVKVSIVSGGGTGGTASDFGAAVPAAGTAAGFSDGTNMQAGRASDLDSGAGTEYGQNVSLRIAASGGSIPITAGAGAVAAGTPRVAEATDSQLSAANGATGDAAATAGSTGSHAAKLRLMTTQLDAIQTAIQTLDNAISGSGFNISQIGGAAPAAAICDDPSKVTTFNINLGAGTGNTELVALNGSDLIYVCSYALIVGGADGTQLIYGTGTACATGETDLMTLNFAAAGDGIVENGGGSVITKAPAGNALCVERTNSVTLSGRVSYVRQP